MGIISFSGVVLTSCCCYFPRNNNQEIVSANRNKFCWQGGFDMIRSGRDKIETPEQVGLPVSVTLLLKVFI